MSETVPIAFDPSGRTVWVERGSTVLDAARRVGLSLSAPCAGRGVCGGCGVRVTSGELAPPDEAELLGLRRAPSGVRLACRSRIEGAVTVLPVIPHAVRTLGEWPRGLEQSRDAEASHTPLVAAVDLGTSTVAAVVIERETRVELGRAVVPNRQSAWGADVLSRVSAALAGHAPELREAAEASVLDALVGACSDEGRCLASIERLIIAGNTVMASLLLGLDAGGLGAHPFVAPYSSTSALPKDGSVVAALAPGAEALVLPPLAGFVGGDIVAGLLAGGMEPDGWSLFVDLGTNAEIVLDTPQGLVVASAAAGPAFDGAGIASGGPAAEGAVERVDLGADGELVVDVVGQGEPRWLCGSGLVSAVALLHRLGHIGVDGKLSPAGPLEDRFTTQGDVRAVRLVAREPAEPDVVLTQLDVRSFQLAKAAVRVGIVTVVHESGAGKVPADVVIAGAFGASLTPRDLVDVGLLPSEFAGRVRIAGNTSLIGAAMIAVDPALETGVSRARGEVRHVELALDPSFQERFLAALALAPYALGNGR